MESGSSSIRVSPSSSSRPSLQIRTSPTGVFTLVIAPKGSLVPHGMHQLQFLDGKTSIIGLQRLLSPAKPNQMKVGDFSRQNALRTGHRPKPSLGPADTCP